MTQRISETREEFLERCREFDRKRAQNPSYVMGRRKYMRVYRLKHLERERARTRRWWSNPENRKRSYQRQMLYAKTSKGRKGRTEMIKRKRATNLNYRIKDSLRQRIHNALKGLNKSASTLKLLGCDAGFLRLYLEARFKKGMTWANYGDWNIDHIIPCAEFDLTDPRQQRQCFNYTNLQPLWGADNISKSNKCPKSHQFELM